MLFYTIELSNYFFKRKCDKMKNYLEYDKTLHKLQKAVYKNKPVGVIKFANKEHLDDLKNGEIYLQNVEYFRNDREDDNDITNDPDEGKFNFNGLEFDITKTEVIQSYISCFSLLFEDDFDSSGYLKKETVNRLNDSRPYVIADFDSFHINYLYKLWTQTPRLINRWLPSPKVKHDDNDNIAFIHSGAMIEHNLEKEVSDALKRNGFDEEFIKEAQKQLLKDRNIEPDFREALYGTGLIKENISSDNQLEEFTFHGGYVYYSDNYKPFKNGFEKIMNNLGQYDLSKENMKEHYEKLIECCVRLKKEHYSRQKEYRILVSNFNFAEELNGIKLIPDSSLSIPFKAYCDYNSIDNLNREDF